MLCGLEAPANLVRSIDMPTTNDSNLISLKLYVFDLMAYQIWIPDAISVLDSNIKTMKSITSMNKCTI